MEIMIILAVALVVDSTLGEFPNPVHPVVWMGKLASFFEKYGAGRSPLFQFAYGALMTLFLTGLFAAAAYFVLAYLKSLNVVPYVIIGALLLKSSFSLKALHQAALRVKALLLRDKLAEARYELRSLVSRNTQNMSKPQAVSATVESVAENICDSFVAPLFFFLLFGVPGAIGYRMVNTLDAMIGYHGKYEYLGKFAARLDDVLNFIPARLSALLLVLASFLSRQDGRAAWLGVLSDHSKTESPNAGWTMAAVAGALDIQLEKVGHYRLGKAGTALVPETIDASLQIVSIASLIWVAICFAAGGIHFALTT
ncbi:MAG: cobalamin biosynthesis protein [Chloroflexi bacterium]|nr:cobalamin biosynthesis protein [Chloroflexota bacterium]